MRYLLDTLSCLISLQHLIAPLFCTILNRNLRRSLGFRYIEIPYCITAPYFFVSMQLLHSCFDNIVNCLGLVKLSILYWYFREWLVVVRTALLTQAAVACGGSGHVLDAPAHCGNEAPRIRPRSHLELAHLVVVQGMCSMHQPTAVTRSLAYQTPLPSGASASQSL